LTIIRGCLDKRSQEPRVHNLEGKKGTLIHSFFQFEARPFEKKFSDLSHLLQMICLLHLRVLG
jgi:hypothetical protein